MVKELLKIANVLYEASTTKSSEDEVRCLRRRMQNIQILTQESAWKDIITVPPLDISSKIPQLKTCRLLATEITERGATLYDLLGKEMELRVRLVPSSDHKIHTSHSAFAIRTSEQQSYPAPSTSAQWKQQSQKPSQTSRTKSPQHEPQWRISRRMRRV